MVETNNILDLFPFYVLKLVLIDRGQKFIKLHKHKLASKQNDGTTTLKTT